MPRNNPKPKGSKQVHLKKGLKRSTMNDLDFEILLRRGMGVREIAAYDGCTQRASHDAMARYLYKSGMKTRKPSDRGPAMGKEARTDSLASLGKRYDMDLRLYHKSWIKMMYWVDVEKEARRNAREAVR